MVEIRTPYFQGDGGAGAPPFFHGDGGAGAPPFFQGDGGAGAPPFFHVDGGAGAPPFAMITDPLPLPATAVFSPIAPTRMTIAATTVSFLDIVPPRNTTIPEVLYRFRHQCQEVRRADLYFFCRNRIQPLRTGLMTDDVRKSPCRHENASGWECVSQQYTSTKTRVWGLGCLGSRSGRERPGRCRIRVRTTDLSWHARTTRECKKA